MTFALRVDPAPGRPPGAPHPYLEPPATRDDGTAALAGEDGEGPLTLRPDGPALVGWARLADAAGLASRLGRDAGDHRALVLAAYDRWGPEAGERLDGHYAVALWDPGRRRAWAARDPFGVGAVFWRRDAGVLAIAGTIEALLAGGVPSPNEAWVAEYLAEHRMDAEATPFLGIRRLPPGHALVASPGEAPVLLRQRALWPAAAVPPGEALEALRAALDASVARALEAAPGRVGAMLSGGLDSGGIAALAGRRSPAPLRTYSITYPGDARMDERPWIDATLSAGGRFAPAFLAVDGDAVADQSGRALAGREHPASGYGSGILWALHARAAADGCAAVMDGHGGDEVVGAGLGHLRDLAGGLRLLALWRAAGPSAVLAGGSRLGVLIDKAGEGGPNRWVRGAARRLGRAAPADRLAWRRMVSGDLAARTDLVARARTERPQPEGATPDAARHLARLDPVLLADGAEALGRIARPHGIRPLYPFYDEALLAACLAVPDSEKLRGGWPRAHLRHAMEGVLPDAVRWRLAKTDFTPGLVAELRLDRAGDLATILRRGSDAEARVAPFVDLQALRAAAGRVRDPALAPDSTEARQVFRVLALADWLAKVDGAGHG